MVKKLWVVIFFLILICTVTVCKKNTLDYVPVLLSPENGTLITQNPPTLKWEKLYERESYDVQVSENSSFQDATLYFAWTDFQSTIASYTLRSELSPGTYYWRVRWAEGAGG